MHCSVTKLWEIEEEIQINYLEFYYHIPPTAVGGLFRVSIPTGLESRKKYTLPPNVRVDSKMSYYFYWVILNPELNVYKHNRSFNSRVSLLILQFRTQGSK